jgi:hypothetical protein
MLSMVSNVEYASESIWQLLGHVTESQRKQVLGQSQGVFDNAYLSSISKIHIQNLFLGKQPRVDFIEELQSISRFRMEGFPIHLPFRERAAALEDPSLAELESKRRELSISDNAGRKQLENDIKSTKARLLAHALKRYQKEWADTEYERYIETHGKSDGKPDPQQRRFQRLLTFIPERQRLCDVIGGLVEYSEERRVSVVEDLISLIRRDSEETYRPGEAPVDGHCPVVSCALRLPG